jgi:3-oxoacyl-[acyl-carrier-protein] synthase III
MGYRFKFIDRWRIHLTLNMKKAFIRAISYYLPKKIVTNFDLAKKFPEWSTEKIANKLGIKQRHVAADNETAMDMGIKAAMKLIEEHNIVPSDIDFIILCTQSPDYFLPTSACVIQNKLGIPISAGALDINLGCSGFIYGLVLSKGLIATGTAKNILLITSETYSKMIHPQDKSNQAIFGDAAAATLISVYGFAEILNFSLGTDGRGYDNLIIKTGGFRHKLRIDDLTFDEYKNPVSSDYLFMNGSEILSFTLDAVPKLIDNVLNCNSLTINDINLFIFHQANKYILDFLRKKIRIDENRYYYFIENVGNTVSATIPIAINEAKKEDKLKGNVLLAGFGVGYSWGATIIKSVQFDELEA